MILIFGEMKCGVRDWYATKQALIFEHCRSDVCRNATLRRQARLMKPC